MLMATKGSWTFMFHGVAFLDDIQQSGPRGGDKLFSTNWLMPMAQRKLGKGVLTLRAMLSLEPATISQRRYPELFQQGETAFGLPIADGQHPHNFFMELAAAYDYKLSENTMLSFYAAPMGDPAMGPVAYPHRPLHRKTQLLRLGITWKTRRTSRAMSSQWVSRAEISDWRRQVSTGANRTNTAGIWLRAGWIRGRAA